jgi:hypothetical protein
MKYARNMALICTTNLRVMAGPLLSTASPDKSHETDFQCDLLERVAGRERWLIVTELFMFWPPEEFTSCHILRVTGCSCGC